MTPTRSQPPTLFPTQASTPTSTSATRAAAAGPTVLLVEDDRTTRALIAGVLEANGFQVLQAGRRSEAQSLFNQRVDMMLVDGLLPDGTGVHVTADFHDAGYQAPVVFLTSFFRDSKSSRALLEESGAAAVVHKPFTARDLLQTMRRALEPAMKLAVG